MTCATLFYISDSLIPSSKANSIQVMQMCEAFSQAIGNVTLFCRAARSNVGDIYAFYGVKNSFALRRISLPRMKVIDRLVYAYTVISEIRATPNQSIIYGRELFTLGLACLLLRPNQNRLALEVHGPPPGRFWRWWVGRMIASGRLTRLVTISAALADKYLLLYPDLGRETVLVAHDGAREVCPGEISTGDGGTSFPQISTQPRIGYVGSLLPGKGMEIIKELARKLPDLEFHVVGGDEDVVRSWRNKAQYRNLIFHGFVDPSLTDDFISKFDVVLAPYQPKVLVGNGDIDISAWMSPLKVFEYMRMGKPLVASDLPVLREVLKDGENALLAQATSPGDWAQKISILLSDSNLREKLGRNARKDFQNYHTWTKRADLIIASLGEPPRRNAIP